MIIKYYEKFYECKEVEDSIEYYPPVYYRNPEKLIDYYLNPSTLTKSLVLCKYYMQDAKRLYNYPVTPNGLSQAQLDAICSGIISYGSTVSCVERTKVWI